MQRFLVLALIPLLAFIVGLCNTLAIRYYLYWHYPYFDVLPHSAAGIMVGLVVYLFARHRLKPADAWWVAFFGAIAVGVAWESFEYGSGVTKNEPGFVFDTVKDLTMDTIGGLIGATIARKNNI